MCPKCGGEMPDCKPVIEMTGVQGHSIKLVAVVLDVTCPCGTVCQLKFEGGEGVAAGPPRLLS